MVYLGGLDRSGTDGEYAYCFYNDITQVIFHVATMMPTDLMADPSCSNKKLHIGNDFVTIVYNDSGVEYKFGTIKVCACKCGNRLQWPRGQVVVLFSEVTNGHFDHNLHGFFVWGGVGGWGGGGGGGGGEVKIDCVLSTQSF